jgi:deoxyxylulose-5-phosphate synthase
LILESIHGPEDVQALAPEQLRQLADEVRQRLIDVVSQTGGHIGAGLGVVELTVALCAAFESPRDKIVWDVGHQGYPWKILTGRNDRLGTLRQRGGLSGFLRRDESEHDQFGAGHAGTALSAAFGMATARDLKHDDYHVVAVVGDGAMTCGLPYEALNNAGDSGRDIIVVLNDNGMSIAPNVGAISKYFGSIVASPFGVRMRERVKHVIERASHVIGGKKLLDFAKNVEESIKNLWSPGMLFEELGFRYFGPIDGHNIAQMMHTFDIVKTLNGPRVVHVLTEGLSAARTRSREVPRPRAVRPRHRQAQTGQSRPAAVDQGVRGGADPARRGRREFRRDYGGDAVGHGHEHFPEAVAGAVLRRGDCRGARDHLRCRFGDARRPADRRDLLDVPAARLRLDHPRCRDPEAARDLRARSRGDGR